jgi:hypothetical protein
MSALVFLLLIFNFAVSWFNAWSVGRSWNETKAVGGISRFMAWCGAIMSASGFTWCYLVILTLINSVLPHKYALPQKYADAVMALGYLAIILPVIGSGIAITIQSWAYFWRERTFKNGAVAGYNTFADIYNIYEAIDAIPDALSIVGKAFGGSSSSDDDDDSGSGKLVLIVIVLVILCLIGGILTTTVIIRCTARNEAQGQKLRASQEWRNRRGETVDAESN